MVDGHDIGVIDRGKRTRFAPEALEAVGIRSEIFGEDFEGNVAPELRVPRAVHRTHRALADGFDDGVVRQRATDHRDSRRSSARAPLPLDNGFPTHLQLVHQLLVVGLPPQAREEWIVSGQARVVDEAAVDADTSPSDSIGVSSDEGVAARERPRVVICSPPLHRGCHLCECCLLVLRQRVL